MEKSENEPKAFKILFVGEPGTGAKTSLIKRIIGENFDKYERSTTSCCFHEKRVKTSKGEILLDLWDTIGQDRYRKTTQLFFKDADCFIIGFDIINEENFKEVDYHYNYIKENMENNPLIYLVGNKIDLFLDERVSEEEALKYSKEKNIKYFPVSAKEGTNVDNLIADVVNALIERCMKKNKLDQFINKKNNKTEKNLLYSKYLKKYLNF